MTTQIVKFEASRENTPMAMVDGKIAFPDRKGEQPKIGETWEVEIAGTNPTGKVVFLRLVKKVELYEWKWNDGMGSRSRQPACLVVTASGQVHRFQGSDIPGVVKVVKSDYQKNGKWSNSTFHCVSPQGTTVYSWSQSWEEGLYWPQASWEEALTTVQQSAPQVDPASLEAAIRQHWAKAAAKFDENRQTLAVFAGFSASVEPVSPETIAITRDEFQKMGDSAQDVVRTWAKALASETSKLHGDELINIAVALQEALASTARK